MTSSHGSRTPGSIPVTTTSSHDRRRAGDAFKVNAAGTQGANGGIEGDLLVYQQFERGRSDLRFFDLGSKDRTSPPRGVNTRRWEYWPTISGQWLLFGRRAGDESREIILYDLSTRDATRLDEVGGKRHLPGARSGQRRLRRLAPMHTRQQVQRDPVQHQRGRRDEDPQPRRIPVCPIGELGRDRHLRPLGEWMRQAGSAPQLPTRRPGDGAVASPERERRGDHTRTRETLQGRCHDLLRQLRLRTTRRLRRVADPRAGGDPAVRQGGRLGVRHELASRYQLRLRLHRDLRRRDRRHADGHAAGRVQLRGVGRSVHRQQHDMHAHDERVEVGHGDVH